MARETGNVRIWKIDRGYGFIEPDIGGADLFVHYGELPFSDADRRNLTIGERVTFERGADDMGRPRALRIGR